eukprot:289379_1
MAHHAQNHMPEHDSTFDIQPNPQPFNWILLFIMFIMTTFSIFICVSLIKPVREFLKNAIQRPKLTVICGLLTSVSFCISAVLVTACTLLILLSDDSNHHLYINDACVKSAMCFYLLSQTLLILLFNVRIDETFKGSTIQYPKRCIQSLYLASLSFFIFYLFLMGFLIFEQWNMFLIFAATWVVFYCCLSVILCAMFVHKIQLLIIYCSGEYQMDTALLHLVIKHAILVPTAIATSLVCLILFIVIDAAVAPGKWLPVAVVWVVLDCMMSGVGLFLLFAWNNKHYDRYCGRLHSFCEKRDVLQLVKSHTTHIKRERTKSSIDKRSKDSSRTHTTDSKSKTPNDRDLASIKSSLSPGEQNEETMNASKVESPPQTQGKPALKFVESLRRQLSNRQLSNKNSVGKEDKVLKTHLMRQDSNKSVVLPMDIEVETDIDRQRMERIKAMEVFEQQHTK